MNTRSLSVRLVSWYAELMTVVLVLLGALTLLILHHYLQTNLLDSQTRRARQSADTLVGAMPRNGDCCWRPYPGEAGTIPVTLWRSVFPTVISKGPWNGS